MPQRVLSEQEFNTIAQTLMRQAPEGLTEEQYQRWMTPRLEGAIAESEHSPAPVNGPAIRRFAAGVGEMLNPVTAVKGIAQAVRHPIDTASAMLSAQGEQFGKAGEAFGQGRISEGIGYSAAGAIPLIGPLLAETGEQIGSGDIAGGLGKAAGIAAPAGAVRAVKATTRAVAPASVRARTATALEQGAASRVADVMAPKVGANKTRFGNQAEKVAPAVAKDLAKEGAPFTREGLHTQVSSKLAEAESALDAAADARLASQTFETKPIINALLEKRRQLTAEAVDASQVPRGTVPRDAGTIQTRHVPAPPKPLGKDVVPAPNAARVAMIDQAISEIQQLGPVARYEPIRRIRQSYDGPAKAVYSPSMTADYLKAQGGKTGAADVTGTLRETLAKWDPPTAAANADYSLYKAVDDVLQATAETERVRPRVGRQIMARLTGTLFGQQAAGPAGAVAGYLGAPIVDTALSAGFTTKLKTARLMQNLADAVRSGSPQRVEGILALINRELKTTGLVQTGRVTSPSESQAGATPAPMLP